MHKILFYNKFIICLYIFFDVLLTVHLTIFVSVINQLDAQNVCFIISLFHAFTCFEHMCSKLVEAWNKLIVKQNFCASSWLITETNACTCFVHYVLIIRRSKLYYTASGIITLFRWPSGAQVVRDGHLQVWWYQMLYNTILTSWWWAHSVRNM